jgi:hypothetical protein
MAVISSLHVNKLISCKAFDIIKNAEGTVNSKLPSAVPGDFARVLRHFSFY